MKKKRLTMSILNVEGAGLNDESFEMTLTEIMVYGNCRELSKKRMRACVLLSLSNRHGQPLLNAFI